MTDPLPLTLLDAALRGAALAFSLLLAALLWRDRRRAPAALPGIALTLGLGVQIVSSTPLFEAAVPGLWQAPLVAVSVGNAVLFWIFVQALFDDEFVPRRRHLAAWLAVAGLSGYNCAVGTGPGQIGMGLQRAVPVICSLLAAAAAAAHWRADLVEGRRRLRVFIVATGVAYTLASLAARLASPHGRMSGLAAALDVAALLFIVATMAVRLLRLGGADLLPLPPAQDAPPTVDPEPAAAAPLPPPDPAEERLAATLLHKMREERAYRSENLTVASLAAELGVPEYRLRRLINQRLGHRNFNAFVNGFRLDEARGALADPQQRDTAVLTIALDAGFQSIGPFNRAFKAATGLTPTEFRQQKLAGS